MLACFAAIYGISTVSMLVSVLVDRYQRVFNRKRFLNEEYVDEVLFDDTSSPSINDDDGECLESQIADDKPSNSVSQQEIQPDVREKPDAVKSEPAPSGKVHFIIDYMSDDEDDDATDCDQEGRENHLIHKIAQKLLQSKPK